MNKIPIVYQRDLIIVPAIIMGKDVFNSIDVSLLLDTGSDCTILKPAYLKAIGYTEKDKKRNLEVSTGSGIDSAFEISLEKLIFMGFEVNRLEIGVKDFPMSFHFFNDILGLDFFKSIKKLLILDFLKNELILQDSLA